MHVWTVEGADERTGTDVVRSFDAITEEEAAEAAARQGILVASVRRSSLDDAPAPASTDEFEAVVKREGRQFGPSPVHSASTAGADTLNKIERHVREIKAWVIFIGVVVILLLIFGVSFRVIVR
jgi:hypothetical protein